MKKRRKTKASGATITRKDSKKLSAYDKAFQQHLVDYNLNLDDKCVRPKNIDTILERLGRPRPSLSPTKFTADDYEEIGQMFDITIGESKLMSTVVPKLLGKSDIPWEANLPFNNLEPLTDGSLVDAKPDMYDGANPIMLDPEIRRKESMSIEYLLYLRGRE